MRPWRMTSQRHRTTVHYDRSWKTKFLPRYDASAVYAITQCLTVRLSRSWITSKRINMSSEIFSPSGSHTILVFPYQRGCRYSDGNPLNGGIECKGYDKMTIFFTNISLYIRNGYSQMGTCSETICKHGILFPSIQHLA